MNVEYLTVVVPIQSPFLHSKLYTLLRRNDVGMIKGFWLSTLSMSCWISIGYPHLINLRMKDMMAVLVQCALCFSSHFSMPS